MASAFNDNILQAIRDQGYWVHDDSNIGKRVDGVLKPRINLQSVQALELCKMAAFDNTQNKNLVHTLFNEPVAVFYRGFGQTKRIHCFRNNLTEPIPAEVTMLVVCLCSSNSRISVVERAHTKRLDALNAPNGVLAVPDQRLDELVASGDVFLKEQILDQGGYILIDGRLGWRVLHGKIAFLGILESQEAEDWAPMPLPPTEDRKHIMEEMTSESRTFCTNFVWM